MLYFFKSKLNSRPLVQNKWLALSIILTLHALCLGICAECLLPTDLHHDAYESTWHHEQNHVLAERGGPQGAVLNAHGAQHLLQAELLLQHQAFDSHAHGVHEGQHQEHGKDASDPLDEAGQSSREVKQQGNTGFFNLLKMPLCLFFKFGST